MADTTVPRSAKIGTDDAAPVTAEPHTTLSKGKGKSAAAEDVSMEEEEEEDEEEEEEDEGDEEEEEEDEEEDIAEEIDPSAIVPRSRRAAAQRIDYTSQAALDKAGLTKADLEKDDDAMET